MKQEASKSTNVDFNMALQSLNFDPGSDNNGAAGGNGIPEGAEMALVAAILGNEKLDLSSEGGVTHEAVRQAYRHTVEGVRADLGKLLIAWPSADQAIAGYVMLGEASFAAISRMSTGFGAPLKSDYSAALALDKYLGAAGDADGDGYSNASEYADVADEGVDQYIAVALDASRIPLNIQQQPTQPATAALMTVGIILYPGFEVLDVYGPIEIWSYVEDFRIVLIAEQVGPVLSAQGTSTLATHSFETAPALDILMVPGGNGSSAQVHNPALLDFLRETDRSTRFTTSVCSGSALLARAGILDGHRATSNKRAFYFAEQQTSAVEWVPEARWVESGKMFTSSGVSAGIDMALALVAKIHGIDSARELAQSLEYTWHESADMDPFAVHVNRLTPSTVGSYQLVKAEPAADSSAAVSPRYLRLYFSGTPDVANSSVTLHSAEAPQQEVPLSGMHTMGNNDLMLSVDRPLEAGQYTVHWSVDSADLSAPVTGKYSFQVAAGVVK
jgi:putative intracellular protease/amidase/methionine-rich copper-binding protein CopC